MQKGMEGLPSGPGVGEKMANHMTIGQRAALAIKRRVRFGNVKPELDRLTIPHSSYERWKLGKGDPQGYWLQQMALAGYDVHWILTGEARYKVSEIDFDTAEYEEEND
jgi:hypothetical protein